MLCMHGVWSKRRQTKTAKVSPFWNCRLFGVPVLTFAVLVCCRLDHILYARHNKVIYRGSFELIISHLYDPNATQLAQKNQHPQTLPTGWPTYSTNRFYGFVCVVCLDKTHVTRACYSSGSTGNGCVSTDGGSVCVCDTALCNGAVMTSSFGHVITVVALLIGVVVGYLL